MRGGAGVEGRAVGALAAVAALVIGATWLLSGDPVDAHVKASPFGNIGFCKKRVHSDNTVVLRPADIVRLQSHAFLVTKSIKNTDEAPQAVAESVGKEAVDISIAHPHLESVGDWRRSREQCASVSHKFIGTMIFGKIICPLKPTSNKLGEYKLSLAINAQSAWPEYNRHC